MRVMLVDDDDSVRWYLRKALERLGHDVSAYPDASSFLEALSESRAPDFVITDNNLGNCLKGTELAISIAEVAPRTPVILFSGDNIKKLEREVYPGTIHVILPKPANLKSLHIAMRCAGEMAKDPRWEGSPFVPPPFGG